MRANRKDRVLKGAAGGLKLRFYRIIIVESVVHVQYRCCGNSLIFASPGSVRHHHELLVGDAVGSRHVAVLQLRGARAVIYTGPEEECVRGSGAVDRGGQRHRTPDGLGVRAPGCAPSAVGYQRGGQQRDSAHGSRHARGARVHVHLRLQRPRGGLQGREPGNEVTSNTNQTKRHTLSMSAHMKIP